MPSRLLRRHLGEAGGRTLTAGTLNPGNYQTVIGFAGQGGDIEAKTDALGHTHLVFAIQDTDVVTGGPVYSLWHARNVTRDATAITKNNGGISTGAPVIAYQLRSTTSTELHLTRKLPNGTWSPQFVMAEASSLRDGLTILPSGTGRILYTMNTVHQAFQSFICF